jgi:hypothetical protein
VLPPYIIEEIRRREQEQQRRYEQPRIELPLPPALPNQRHNRDESDKDRGVVIIDLSRRRSPDDN